MDCDPLRQLWKYPDQLVWFKEWTIQQASYIPVNKPPFTLGVNASEWIIDLERPVNILNSIYTRPRSVGEIRSEIIMHLGHYISLPLHLIFVEDVPHITKLSRSTQKIWELMKTLVEAFGFHWHTAPIYAITELAHMNKLGFVHAIITDDFRTFLYGADMLIGRLTFTPDTLNHTGASIYQLKSGLSCSSLILIHLLCGHAHLFGNTGWSIEKALEAVRCGHDDQLCDSYQQFSPADFIAFCPIFRAELEAINDVPRLSSSFPAGDILATLLSPTVSSKHVLSLQLNTYRGYTFPRAHLLANILKGTALMDTSIHMSICQGLALRLLLDCRDVPWGLRNSLAWSIKHFEPFPEDIIRTFNIVTTRITVNPEAMNTMWMELTGGLVNEIILGEYSHTFALPVILLRDVPSYIITRLV
ncbi:hypothetical protein QCA50_000969 [Cerrena zonata]|uniref:XPG-I domain-containing protein n=1 Tax=Cerrena zonata TaxID=2478898 RepID=A0AAW0GSW3_9APHY